MILLSDDCVPFCYCSHNAENHNMISLSVLRSSLEFAHKHDLQTMAVLPNWPIPDDYLNEMGKSSCGLILPALSPESIDGVRVFNEWNEINGYHFHSGQRYLIRTSRRDLFKHWSILPFQFDGRIDIIVVDIADFTDKDFDDYYEVLLQMAAKFESAFRQGYRPETNILTDRVGLSSMTNCNAGVDSLTIAPNGKLYVCPGFYYESWGDVSIDDINDAELLDLKHAPICQHCDAFHCKRCVWMNKKHTLEVNTPSRQQCIVSHLERNVSRRFMLQMADILPKDYVKIPEINYLDPFDNRGDWN